MTSAFQSINNSLGAVAGAAGAVAAAAGASGGQFAFSESEVEALSKDWLKLAEGYNVSLQDSRRVAVEGPGDEPASQGQADAAMKSWERYTNSLEQKLDYALSQAQKYADALSAYRGTDHQSVTKLLGLESKQGGI